MNKFPDFVRYTVQRLKALSPSMDKVKIAETLCRAGLHLGVTTALVGVHCVLMPTIVQRMRCEDAD